MTAMSLIHAHSRLQQPKWMSPVIVGTSYAEGDIALSEAKDDVQTSTWSSHTLTENSPTLKVKTTLTEVDVRVGQGRTLHSNGLM